VADGDNFRLTGAKPIGRCKVPLKRYIPSPSINNGESVSNIEAVVPIPESFRLTDAKGKGFRGNLVLGLRFLPSIPGQTGMLETACTGPQYLRGSIHVRLKTLEIDRAAAGAPDGADSRSSVWTVSASLQVGMALDCASGSDLSVVKSSPATASADCNNGDATQLFMWSTSASDGIAEVAVPWDINVARRAWDSGQAVLLRLEACNGPRPLMVGWIPAAALLHRRGAVVERELTLLPLDGAGVSHDSSNTSLVVAAQFIGQEDDKAHVGDAKPTPRAFSETADAVPVTAGQLMVRVCRARNLGAPSMVGLMVAKAARSAPSVRLTLLPDNTTAGTKATKESASGLSFENPIWEEALALRVADAVTSRLLVEVLEAGGSSAVFELPVVAVLSASLHPSGKAEAKIPVEGKKESKEDMECGMKDEGKFEAGNEAKDEGKSAPEEEMRAHMTDKSSKDVGQNVHLEHGLETWIPLYHHGKSPRPEPAGEVRLAFRFVPEDFLLQRELMAGLDEGASGPQGPYRYRLERRPGRLYCTVHRAARLPKPLFGERRCEAECAVVPSSNWGKGKSTRPVTGLDPCWEETVAGDIFWTPQDSSSPVLNVHISDTGFGGGRLARLRLPLAPFILHPRMPAVTWHPLTNNRSGSPEYSAATLATGGGLFLSTVYIPSTSFSSLDRGEDSCSFDPDLMQLVTSKTYTGAVNVQAIAARDLPASVRDPYLAMRLRWCTAAADGQPPGWVETAACIGGKSAPQFDAEAGSILLPFSSEPKSGEGGKVSGMTPSLEVQVREKRDRKVVGFTEIPIFPLWLGLGHMTRTWYPLKSWDAARDGKADAGKLFLGLQYVPSGDRPSLPAESAISADSLEIQVVEARGLRSTMVIGKQVIRAQYI
jgi:hypothetical protein